MMGKAGSKEERAQLDTALQQVQRFRSIVADLRVKLGTFRETVAGLPPMTTSLNKAKRSAVDALDFTDREFDLAGSFIKDMEANLQQLAGAGSEGK